MIRKASAEWKGNRKEGKGAISTESGALKGAHYAFATRFENSPGTNPEELVGAALAGCFSQAYAGKLTDAGFPAEYIRTSAAVTMEKTEAGFTVTGIHLDVAVKAPGGDPAVVAKNGEEAKAGCPISRLLSPGTKVTMSLKVE